MPEGSNMWGTLTAESFTPWLEFDFIYQDTWDSGVLAKSRVSAVWPLPLLVSLLGLLYQAW